MSSYYVYKVVIHHPSYGDLIYIGKHSWDGPPGELDPSYHGSCQYIYYKSWLIKYPYTEYLLFQGTKEEVASKEEELIFHCLQIYGSFLKQFGIHPQLTQFRQGFCLNGHWGGGSNLNEETHRKGLETRRPYLHEIIMKGFHSKDLSAISKKGLATKKSTGVHQRVMSKLHSPESRTKFVLTMRSKGLFAKSTETLQKIAYTRHLNARKVQVTSQELDDFVGGVHELVSILGWPKGSACSKVSEAYKNGIAKYKNFILIPIK